ncbi:MAG: hypothetical protein JKY65_32570 [Planctomycetes bacterium]|nr:hypothetical protein [Planctomycetota bacterium]
MRRVALWVILGVLLLASGGTASARPLTPKEKAFARDLQRALGLTISKAGGLTSRTGVSGVRFRFPNLTVVRLNFPTLSDAQAYLERSATKGSGTNRGPTRRADLRGKELVLIGGKHLADSTVASQVLAAVWGASLDPPSLVTAKRNSVIRTASGKKLVLRPIRPSKPAHVPPTASNLGGTYLTTGVGRVVIDQIRAEPDCTYCRVRFENFGRRPTLELRAVFDGGALILYVPSESMRAPTREVTYVWKPSPTGAATFRRLGQREPALPPGAARFWDKRAE